MLDPWQRLVLDGALRERSDGNWAARRVGLVVPRQNGKGAILEAKALHSLFLTDQKLILWSAHLFPTAREGFLRLRNLIESNSELNKRVRNIYDANGRESVWLKDGTRLLFIARSKGGGRGFSPDEVIFDEAMILEDVAVSALSPSMSARPNPQRWYVGSAPLEDSEVFRRICKQGRSGESDSLAYAEWCAEPGADLDSWEPVAQANPGFMIRLMPSSVIDDREDMTPEDYARERAGLWYEDDEDVILPGWKSLFDPQSRIEGTACLAIDASPLGRSAALAVVGRRGDGKLHGEITSKGDEWDHRPGLAWVVPRVAEIVANNNICCVILDPSGPAGALVPALVEAGVKTSCTCHGLMDVQESTARQTAQAYGILYDAVVERGFFHLGQEPLQQALKGATRRELSDAFALSRRHSSVDISPLVALTLATYGFSVHGTTDYDVMDSILWTGGRGHAA